MLKNKKKTAPVNPRTTITMTDDEHEDLRACKQQCGIEMSKVLMTLYGAWRQGKISLSSLPDGTLIKGPLVRRKR